jgi:hypothetical protein
MIKKLIPLTTVLPLLLCALQAKADVAVTVYNQDLGLVREQREISLEKGIHTQDLSDVAALIIPASVHLKSLTRPDALSVLEQNFQYDLVSRDRLLQKYIGKEIEIERYAGNNRDKKENIRGRLLSVNDGITLAMGDRIIINPEGEIMLPGLPEGLMLKPTLSWILQSSISGTHPVELDYMTRGMTWNADYVVVLAKDDKTIGLTGWVTIDNRSGVTYHDARLKVVAGDVNIVPAMVRAAGKYAEMADNMASAAAPQFEEKTFFEYHMYTLQRPATLKDNETKQIEFASAERIPVKKIFTFNGFPQPFAGYNEWARTNRDYGRRNATKINVTLAFTNSESNNIGMPLPKGTVRVYKEDSDKALEFVGEDRIDHTPKNEDIKIHLGDAFDLNGERTQTDFKCGNDWCEESFKIVLRNHKSEPVEIVSIEPMYRWSNWKITAKSSDFKKTDSRTIEFTTKIPANGEQTITYTVRYWW